MELDWAAILAESIENPQNFQKLSKEKQDIVRKYLPMDTTSTITDEQLSIFHNEVKKIINSDPVI